MSLRPFNSVAGFNVGESPQQNIILANGDITTINFTANGVSNLGPISNVHITGGNFGQVIQTDGSGNLTFASLAQQNSAAPMPFYIPVGNTAVVPANYQGLYSTAITIDGTFEVDGELIQIGDTTYANTSEVLFANLGSPTGNLGFTFNSYNGNLQLPGNLNITGNIIPSISNTFSLGTSTNRFTNIWLKGNTIYLGNSVITETNGNLVLQNPAGAQLVVTGTSTSSDLTVSGNVIAGTVRTDNYQYANGAPFEISGNLTGTSASVTGNVTGGNLVTSGLLTVTGNATVGNLSVTGSFNAGNIVVSSISDGTSNIAVAYNGNITMSVGGTSNVVTVTSSGQVVSGTLSATGDITAADLITTNGCVVVGGTTIAVIGTQGGIFNSSITDINIGINANLVLGSSTGKVTTQGNLVANGNITTNNLTATNFISKRPSITVTSNTVIDSFEITTYRSAKYTLKISDSTGYQAMEVLLIHDSINSLITVYGSLSMTGLDLVTLSTSISGTTVQLFATAINSSASVNLMGTYVPD